jgi:hypothetical protein
MVWTVVCMLICTLVSGGMDGCILICTLVSGGLDGLDGSFYFGIYSRLHAGM